MDPERRAHFFERWEGLSPAEREAFQQRMQRAAGGRGADRAELRERPRDPEERRQRRAGP